MKSTGTVVVLVRLGCRVFAFERVGDRIRSRLLRVEPRKPRRKALDQGKALEALRRD